MAFCIVICLICITSDFMLFVLLLLPQGAQYRAQVPMPIVAFEKTLKDVVHFLKMEMDCKGLAERENQTHFFSAVSF